MISKRGFGRRGISALGAVLVAACFASTAVAAPHSSRGAGSGLWLVTATGRVEALGGAPALSPAASWTRQHVVVAAAGTPTGGGLWLLAVDGSVLPVGDAAAFGPVPPARTLAGRAVGIAATPDGAGYLVAYADGRVEPGGDAVTRGNASLPRGLGHEVAAIAITPTGQGYWLVGLDGHVYAFGDAPALAPVRLGPFDALVTAAAPTATGRGLWIGSADGHVTALGDAAPLLPASRPLRGALTALAPTPSGGGLWLASLTGNVEARGDAAPLASTGLVLPAVAAVASAPTGTLTVNVTDLPAGSGGAVTVTGSGPQYTVPVTETLRVAPGSYSVTADAVHAAHTSYRPTITGTPAFVVPGENATAIVDYLWAIPDTTKRVVSSAVEDATGDPKTGLTLTLDPASAPSLAVGDIVVVGITDATPYGWIGKVASLSSSAGALTVTTTLASLTDAFTRGEIHAQWGPDGNSISDGLASSARVTQAHRRSQDLLQNIEAQIPDNFSCGGSASAKLSGDASVTSSVAFHVSWGGIFHPTDVNGDVTSHFGATASAGFTASTAASCTLDPTEIAELPPIPLGDALGFVITLKLELDVSAGVSTDAAVTTSVHASESADLGASDHDGSVSLTKNVGLPKFTEDRPAPTANADAWVKIGPRATVLIEGAAGPFVDLNAGVHFHADASVDPWWTLDATLDSDIGLSFLGHDFGTFHLFNDPYPLLQATEPPPTGSGGGGGDNGGNGGDNGNGGDQPPPAYCGAGAQFPLTPGDSVPVDGYDFAPNETVRLALDGGGSLGTVTTDDSGAFSTTVTIPSDAAGGDHSIVGTGAAGTADDTCSTSVTVYTGPPPGTTTAGQDDGSYAAPIASAPRTVESLNADSASWPSLPADVLPGDVLFAVATTGAPGWTTADVEGSTVVSYLVVPADPSTVDLSALPSGAIVTVANDVDPNDPVAGHTNGAARGRADLFSNPFYYTFDDPAYCPYGVTPPCSVNADPKVIEDPNWVTNSVPVQPGQGLLGWETTENSSEALAYASCTNIPTVTCPYPAWGYSIGLELAGSPFYPLAASHSSDFLGVDQLVDGPNGAPVTAPANASGSFDGALFCEPRGPYAYDEGTQDAVDSPIGADGSPQACHAWMASPESVGALVLNPRPPGTNPLDDSPPTRPDSIVTTRVGPTEVDLSWQPSSDNTGVIGYAVFRDGVWLATVTGTSFTDTGVQPFTPDHETAYHYAVVAIDGFGNSSGGATMDVVPQLPDTGGGGGAA